MSLPVDKSGVILPISQDQPLQQPNSRPQPYMAIVQGYTPDEFYNPIYERRRPSLLRRILRGILFFTVFFLFCKLVFRAGAHISHWFGGHGHLDIDDGLGHYEIPSHHSLDGCAQESDWIEEDVQDGYFFRTAKTEFEIPLVKDNIFLLSRGQLSSGVAEITTSPDQAKDSVTFIVKAHYHRKEVRDLAKVCLVTRDGKDEEGVGIFTPTWRRGGRHRRREDSMHFTTTVVFPDFSDDVLASYIKSFSTDVPNTTQQIGYLRNKVHFDLITLKGSNAQIDVESLVATIAALVTSNGPIRGVFNSTKSVSLHTSNAPIEAEVSLVSDFSKPVLVAKTSNGHLNAKLRLLSAEGNEGTFTVSTTTSNSPLSVEYLDAPLNSILAHTAHTTNGHATVSLHPTFEGAFDVETSSWFKAEVNFLPAEDPSGQHRKRRTWAAGHSKNHVSGKTSWTDANNAPPGVVTIHTSNAHAALDILGI